MSAVVVDRDHDRHGAGRRRQVHHLVRLVGDLHQFAQHVDRRQAGPLEDLREPLAPAGELLQLLAGELAAPGQVGEHPLAVVARLGHHVAALLLGLFDLGLGIVVGVVPLAGDLEVDLLAQRGRLLLGFPEQPGGALLRLRADRDRRLARRRQHPRRLLTQELGDGLLVERALGDLLVLAQRLQLALEVALTLLQAAELGGDHPKEVTDLGGIEAAAHGREPRRRDCGRRRRIGSREGDGHCRNGRTPTREIRGKRSVAWQSVRRR